MGKTKRIKKKDRKTKGHKKTKRRQVRLKRTQKGGNESTETLLTDAKNLSTLDFMKKYKIIVTAENQNIDYLVNIYEQEYTLSILGRNDRDSRPQIYNDADKIEEIMNESEVKPYDYMVNLYYIIVTMIKGLEENLKKIGVITRNGLKNRRNNIFYGPFKTLNKSMEILLKKINEMENGQMEEEEPNPELMDPEE